ncbi:DNA adenine methylase [Microbacterium sp. NPDC058269]|uniref:DNA adenine methylase n=1 Tax=Microbacterium sp. NPDC058269 TaxID=3346414 RepID=UPI0036DEDEE0
MDTLLLPTKRIGPAASPLRYPGGKAVLAGFFAEVLDGLDLESPTYVEPFAGGVGAGVELLLNGRVASLVVNDIDAAVFSFWTMVLERTDEFVERVLETPLNLEEWGKQRELYKMRDERDRLALGFAFFYLNRTNRSGVLNAGVIGGKAQTGKYLIDARFNRSQLADRIRAIGALRDQITVTDEDGKHVITRYASDPNAFVYIDPPYVDMGGSLYLNAFDHRDHAELAATVNAAAAGNWVLTYDMSPVVIAEYASRHHWQYELNYSGYRKQKARELIVVSDPVARALERMEQLRSTLTATA